MQVEQIDSHVLPVILDWWKIRELGEMDPDILPPIGYFATGDDGPIAAAWIYQPIGCKVAILDWLVTAPWLPERPARLACRAVYHACAMHARRDGAVRMFAAAERPGIVLEAQKVGFAIASEGITHLVKHL